MILKTCERKALSEHDSSVHILEMHTETMHGSISRELRNRNKILPHSAQILFGIGTVFAMLVNACSSNHDTNHEADRDPKRLSECDSFLCEQALCDIYQKLTSESTPWNAIAIGLSRNPLHQVHGTFQWLEQLCLHRFLCFISQ